MSVSDTGSVSATSATVSDYRRWMWWVAGLCPLVIGLGVYAFHPAGAIPPWCTVLGLCLILLVVATMITDLAWHQVPNWATYPAVLWGLALNASEPLFSADAIRMLGTVGFTDSLLGAVIPFTIFLVIFSFTGGGAGDVKLTAALGGLLGYDRGLEAMLFACIIAGGFALISAIWRYGPVQIAAALWRGVGSFLFPIWMSPPSQNQRKLLRSPMPLAPSFGLAALLVLCEIDIAKTVDGLRTMAFRASIGG